MPYPVASARGMNPPQGAAAAFSPTDVAGLDSWFDFSDSSTLWEDAGRTDPVDVDGDLILGVTDKSGDNYHLSTSSGAAPVYKIGIKNGLSVARFDASDDTLLYDTHLTQVLDIYFYAVVDTTNLGTNWRALLERNYEAPPHPPVLLLGADLGDNYEPTIYWGTNSVIKYGTAIQRWQIVRYRLTSSVGGVRVDDQAEQTAAHSNTALQTWDRINHGTTQQCAIDLGEVLLYQNTTISAENDASIMSYLNDKWAVY